ncbi:MAG: CocE/NonD family hydrolase [bacterium]|nr:CocE/NonD family hydrolase [bacterium]
MKYVILGMALVGMALAGAQEIRVSEPFEYEGYSGADYASHSTSSAYVPMPDGEKLAADVFIPTDGPSDGPFPVILMYTPYCRSNVNPETGEIGDLGRSERGRFFLPHGYAMVVADMRGTGASTGWLQDFMPQLADDGKVLVDWIAGQAWCDGHVGMMGDSYLGWSQLATASRRPEALKCIAPGVIPLDGYTGEVAPGGVFLAGFFEMFSSYMDLILHNRHLPQYGILPTKPAEDEDGDGEWADEIPVDQDGSGDFLDDGFPPKYRDGNERKHVYFNATLAHHEGNHNYMEWASKIHFADVESPLGYTMYDMSPSGFVAGTMESGIPVLHVGGWFDGFTRGTTELFSTMRATNRSKMLMPPSYHDFNTGPFWSRFGYEPGKVLQMSLTEHLRFFDRHLKGIENGYDKEPPILLYVMNGKGWRFENEWPLAREERVTYYMNEGHGLTRQRGPDGSDDYTADFTHDSSYGSNDGNRWKGIGMESPDTVPIRTDKNEQCLVYTSPPMAEDMEVTGHPVIRLSVASTEDSGDFFVFLEDVGETGGSILVSEGGLRADFHGLRDNDRMIHGGSKGIEVLPDLPWHGYEEDDHVDAPFADGAVIELVIDFAPTSWVFRKGHRVRVSIACADYPTFVLHPKLSPKNDPGAEDNLVPTVTVHRSTECPSSLELPRIPAKKEERAESE